MELHIGDKGQVCFLVFVLEQFFMDEISFSYFTFRCVNGVMPSRCALQGCEVLNFVFEL